MKLSSLTIIAILGIGAGVTSALIYGKKFQAPPPVAVSYNPYVKGVYATGIVESVQVTGSNINIFAEVSGKVTKIFTQENQIVKQGSPIFAVDDSVQKEVVARDLAQIKYAKASLVNVQQQLAKISQSFHLDPKSVSKNSLDNATNSVKMAQENLQVAQKQYLSDQALWEKYLIKAPITGKILRILATVGDYASPVGTYDTYTHAWLPTIQMGVVTTELHVRAFVDELLVPYLPTADKLEATMFIRGLNNRSIPLEFVSLQPFTIPNIQLSDERTERVDVRVLPIIFKFQRPQDINIFPGQLVDIYLKGQS